jgi:DNA-binding CsgD family transcriptional regulator
VTVHRGNGRPLAIYQLPITPRAGGTVLVLVNLDTSLQPRPLTLQRMFSLTAAEVRLASAIAMGSTPTDLARQRHVSRATVRSQLASIFAKTHTHRQAELVALLARVSLLP